MSMPLPALMVLAGYGVQAGEALLLAGVSGVLGAVIAQVGVPLLVRAAPDAVAGGFRSAPIPGLAATGFALSPWPAGGACWQRTRPQRKVSRLCPFQPERRPGKTPLPGNERVDRFSALSTAKPGLSRL